MGLFKMCKMKKRVNFRKNNLSLFLLSPFVVVVLWCFAFSSMWVMPKSECFLEIGCGFIEFFSPISAYAEEMGKENGYRATNETKSKPNEPIHEDDLWVIYAMLGIIAGILVSYKLSSAIEEWISFKRYF